MRPDVLRCVVVLPLVVAACGAASSGGVAGEAPDGGDGGVVTRADGASGTDAPADADAGGLITVPLTACDPNVYAADMTIGGSQDFHLYLDTGSTTLAVAGLGCPSCSAAGVETLYQPGPTAVDQKVAASAMYGAIDPSGWSGEIYEDWVGIKRRARAGAREAGGDHPAVAVPRGHVRSHRDAGGGHRLCREHDRDDRNERVLLRASSPEARSPTSSRRGSARPAGRSGSEDTTRHSRPRLPCTRPWRWRGSTPSTSPRSRWPARQSRSPPARTPRRSSTRAARARRCRRPRSRR